MKRITSIVLCFVTCAAFSQNLKTAPKFVPKQWSVGNESSQTLRLSQGFLDARARVSSQAQGASRAISVVPIGSAGNMYTILNGTVNRVAANNALNTVTFIHRSNPGRYGNNQDELGRYRYDVSKDGGMTWQLEIGVLNPSGNQLTLAGRYPNAVIHNPAGNTNPNNAHLAYFGTWLPFLGTNPSWDGHFAGVARLDNNPSSFTEDIQSPNNSELFIATGMCNGKPGEFWATNFGSEPFSGIAGVDETVENILLFKGVWSPANSDVVWTLHSTFTPPYDKTFNFGYVATSSVTVAFDPTGRYGWVGMTTDCRDSSRSDLAPVFYSSSDSGATWTGPIILNLNDFPNVISGVPAGSLSASATYDADMVVDMHGNPHLFTVVAGALTDTTILINGLKMYDFTYDPNSNPAWDAIYMDSMFTFRGTLALDEDGLEITEENRPQASVSPDGSKVFVSWLDSDPDLSGGDNTIPNFFAKGLDVETWRATESVNFTVGTPWEGAALFASLAPSSLEQSGTYKVPTVFTRINATGLGTDSATFHYVQDIEFTESQFVIDVRCPYVQVNPLGNDPDYAYLSEPPYNDPGAEAVLTDCVGNVLPPITTDITSNANSAVNIASRGTYTVTYTYSDVDGNYGVGVRDVIVNTEPDPLFGFQVTGNVVKFTDSSLYNPTSWSWDYGFGGAGSAAQSPTFTGYTENGTYNVCLEVRNALNAAPFNKPAKKLCKDVMITSVGIDDDILGKSFSVFPNPASGFLTVEILNDGFDRIQISLLDVVGKTVSHADLGKQGANTRHNFDVSVYPEGVYFVKIQTGLGTVVKRALVSR